MSVNNGPLSYTWRTHDETPLGMIYVPYKHKISMKHLLYQLDYYQRRRRREFNYKLAALNLILSSNAIYYLSFTKLFTCIHESNLLTHILTL